MGRPAISFDLKMRGCLPETLLCASANKRGRYAPRLDELLRDKSGANRGATRAAVHRESPVAGELRRALIDSYDRVLRAPQVTTRRGPLAHGLVTRMAALSFPLGSRGMWSMIRNVTVWCGPKYLSTF